MAVIVHFKTACFSVRFYGSIIEDQPVKHREVWQAIVNASRGRQVKWHSLKDKARPAESLQAEELARRATK
jgi:ribonuclease HI